MSFKTIVKGVKGFERFIEDVAEGDPLHVAWTDAATDPGQFTPEQAAKLEEAGWTGEGGFSNYVKERARNDLRNEFLKSEKLPPNDWFRQID